MTGSSLDSFAKSRLATLAARGRRRQLAEVTRDGTRIQTQGREFVSFACNDYLGLSQHPEVTAAAMAATLRLGAGSGAARLISGNHPEYAALETQLAAFKETEDAVVFGSGYLANIGIITALAGSRDLIVLDELSHSSLRSGAQLCGATTLLFRHNDSAHCTELLSASRQKHRHALVVTEGVFSMDGDRAPLGELVQSCSANDAWLLCDDAHGLGVLGNGRGSVFEAGQCGRVDLQMGTLSKALGSYGGFVCAGHDVCEYLRNRARSFVYSTGLPPGAVAAATKALQLIIENPDLTLRPLQHARNFTDLTGLPAAESAIVPLLTGSSADALKMSDALAELGFFVPAIRPPTVPQGAARLRFAFSAAHETQEVEALARAVGTIVSTATAEA